MANLLYDVVLVAPDGHAVSVLAAGVPMDEALAVLSRRDPNLDMPAVVAFAGTVAPRTTLHCAIESEAPSIASNASEALDDSDAMEDAEDATQRKRGLDWYAKARAAFVQDMLRRHLGTVLNNIELIEDCGDVGIVAQSLEQFCAVIDNDHADDSDAFRCGLHGDWRNDWLEEALGMVPEDAEAVA